nr:pentatricopeptide repeat-containing protein At4g21065-like [Ipomoea batatas]
MKFPGVEFFRIPSSVNSSPASMEITSMTQAMQLHARILKSGAYDSTHRQDFHNLFTFSALSPSGDLNYARHILRTLHSPNSFYYNTMIRAYSDSPDPTHAFTIFLYMQNPDDASVAVPRPDHFTYPFVLKACSKSGHARFGKQIHGLVLKSGVGSDRYINNALIHFYSASGEPNIALKVFDKMPDRDVVSWTSIIDGFVDNDRPIEAIRLFTHMIENGIEPNEVTVASVLRACADTGALNTGERIHSFVKEKSFSSNANVSTALIDMYAKCGCIDGALQVFDETLEKDVYVWTAIIAGLASHGLCMKAIEFFEDMKKSDVKMDERAITAVLSAYRNAGLVSEGLSFFRRLKKHKIRPTIQHYGCVVDMLTRAGRLKDAEEFIRKMPIEPDAVLWRTLIWGCKILGDVERSKRLVRELELLNMDSRDTGSYVLLENVYAATGKWEEKAKTRELMYQRGLMKPPACSRIEIDGVVHEFTAGDSRHDEATTVYEKLEEVEERLRGEGYNPIVSEVLLEIDDDEKASQLLHHSEKLAVSFGLVKSSPGSVIRIVKNLRSCEDCHSFMKLISKVYQRDIIVRDRIRFHHFSGGNCSCGDRW